MLLPDVNVLIYAHFEDVVAEHREYARWLTQLATGPEPFALSVLVLSGFVRIATNSRIFDPPATLPTAFDFVSSLVERPTDRIVGPGPDHLSILENLCREANATGKLVADAQHAAIAVEHGCTMVSTNSDFDRFAGLRWQHPLRPRTADT
ncbi:MAG: type II toxin-antitoxin system VapC family toxin [Gammaproteobacteria bacterium]|nr:type II toxin-antitoxin system VapC family toxin [Gammaproteobacteria bacterium]MXY05623.1 type II toxin-antitoxin system VapC family toxin [Gammaproteobacteria bacterium]MYE50161.1 type II toxin-antitoxin system VapC family toxin [Gammaproteobacteria bacterium]MYF10141.1 type II toxin-antitoxin system VapC family toxin [Gammaproteobacteria bacterium]MYF48873.1 type II toxin-antitoxin system VapC family toxin [Gammaproteobacteria bacterium]